MMRRILATFAVALLGMTGSAAAQQTAAGRLIEQARAQLEELNNDSARVLLERALAPGANASAAEQTRAWVLYGIVQLESQNVPGARSAFRQALIRDRALRVDSLTFLSDLLEREFAAERAAFAPAAPTGPGGPRLTVALVTPDTVVPVLDPRLRIEARPTYRSRVVLVVAPAENLAAPVWTDTLLVGGVGTAAWDLRTGGGVVPAGRYALRATAIDSLGQVSPTLERILLVARVQPDSQPHPPLLGPDAFQPESLVLRRGAPGGLAFGLGLGVLIAGASSVLGSPGVNDGQSGDGTAMIVAGGVTLASVVGFISGSRTRIDRAAIDHNRQLAEQNRQQREAIIRANAHERERADVRITAERSGP